MTPSYTAVSPDFIDYVFIRKIEELDSIGSNIKNDETFERYDVLKMAALLRSLVYDNPLYLRVNRRFKMKIQVPTVVWTHWEGIDPTKEIDEIYKPYCSDIPQESQISSRIWYPYTMQSYLNNPLPGLYVMGNNITAREAIILYANILGGVHLDGKIEEDKRRLAVMHDSIRIGHMSALDSKFVFEVSQDLIRSMLPLYYAIVQERGSAQS